MKIYMDSRNLTQHVWNEEVFLMLTPLILFLTLSLEKSTKMNAEELHIIIYLSKKLKTIKCSTMWTG